MQAHGLRSLRQGSLASVKRRAGLQLPQPLHVYLHLTFHFILSIILFFCRVKMSAAEAPPRTSAEFVESSVLEVLVPSDANLDIKEAVESWDGNVEDEKQPLLPFITERPLLLFGRHLIMP